MTREEQRKLDTILGKLENLQNQTKDEKARERLQAAKSELLRIEYNG